MRRSTKSALPRMGAFAIGLVRLVFNSSSTRASATLIVALRRQLLFNSTPIVSTETFDEFPYPTEFPLLNLNSFTYSGLTLIFHPAALKKYFFCAPGCKTSFPAQRGGNTTAPSCAVQRCKSLENS